VAVIAGEKAAARTRMKQPVEQVFKAPSRELKTQMIGRHVFEGMSFVEDGNAIVRQQANPGPAESQIAEKQGVVHNQQVRAGDLPAGLEIKALLVTRAGLAEAIVAIALDKIPD